MKLSTRSQYGLRLMVALGVKGKYGPMYLKDVARFEGISEKYLYSIIVLLKSKGLVNTPGKAHGGYLISRPASEITLRQIVEPLEGDLELVDTLQKNDPPVRLTDSVLGDICIEMGDRIVRYLDSLTLEDLIRRYENNMKNRAAGMVDYSI